ncbi:Pol-like polyprotein/retrotransposon [Senna tora]|uniref:Pol-like polyprotein/retrotransposon n=1 Tax=Senna tora TaxID=362788 RepID=A0A834WJV6_9FABA|nr:Pol-like polyprotein/retrotransposon [Senna tora]
MERSSNCSPLGSDIGREHPHVAIDYNMEAEYGSTIRHLLSLKLWVPCFNPMAPQDILTSIWIRIENLPLEFFNHEISVRIGNSLGCFLGTYVATHNLLKVRFSRICVLINLSKDLPPNILIVNLSQPLILENLPSSRAYSSQNKPNQAITEKLKEPNVKSAPNDEWIQVSKRKNCPLTKKVTLCPPASEVRSPKAGPGEPAHKAKVVNPLSVAAQSSKVAFGDQGESVDRDESLKPLPAIELSLLMSFEGLISSQEPLLILDKSPTSGHHGRVPKKHEKASISEKGHYQQGVLCCQSEDADGLPSFESAQPGGMSSKWWRMNDLILVLPPHQITRGPREPLNPERHLLWSNVVNHKSILHYPMLENGNLDFDINCKPSFVWNFDCEYEPRESSASSSSFTPVAKRSGVIDAYVISWRDNIDVISSTIRVGLKWLPPNVGHIKLNIDGSCNSLLAELRGLILGLLVESDCSVVVSLENANTISDTHHLLPMILECRSYLPQFNHFSLSYIYRERNSCADLLAKHAVNYRALRAEACAHGVFNISITKLESPSTRMRVQPIFKANSKPFFNAIASSNTASSGTRLSTHASYSSHVVARKEQRPTRGIEEDAYHVFVSCPSLQEVWQAAAFDFSSRNHHNSVLESLVIQGKDWSQEQMGLATIVMSLSDLPHQKRIIVPFFLRIVSVAWLFAGLLKRKSGSVRLLLLFTIFQYTIVMSKFSSAMKFDVEKFDGMINFGLWQVQVKDVLIQLGLHKALEGKISSEDSEKSESNMSHGDWEELDLKAESTIRMCLAKNVLANVQGISTTKEL